MTNEKHQLFAAIDVICNMQNKIKPFCKEKGWAHSEILLAYNIAAEYLAAHPATFAEYLKERGLP